MSTSTRHINWLNTLFLVITPLVAVVGTALLMLWGDIHWQTWVLAYASLLCCGFSVTGGYHRLFSHKAYRAARPVRFFFLLFGAAAFEGSVLEWCTDHRNHHLYTDTDKDPYDIKKGFWFAHIGWLFTLDVSKRDFSNVEDLMQDPLVRLQHQFFPWLAVLMGFVLPMGIASLWGDPWGGLIIAGALRIAVNHHFTFAINSVCHLFGTRPYSEKQSARDNAITALFTFGEGYHNFHHQFPLDYRNGVRFYQFDPTKWLIFTLARLGLVKDLKRVDEHRIVRYRLRADERKWMLQPEHRQGSLLGQLSKAMQSAHADAMKVLQRLEALEKEYAELRRQRMNLVREKMHEYRARMKAHRKNKRVVRRELKDTLVVWSDLVRQRSRLSVTSAHH